MLGRFMVILLWIMTAVPALGFAREQEPRLEGIMEDKVNPAKSVAIIDGSLYQTGDVFSDYKVQEVTSHSAKLFNTKSGKEITLGVKTALKQAPKPVAPTSGSLIDKAKNYWAHPDQAVSRVWEMKTLRDLALINNAAVRYYEKNQFFPVLIRQLTLDGFLAKSYESGKNQKYKFYTTNKPMNPDNFELHADPLEPDSGLRYFFIGPDAVIRESIGKPANAQSPRHEYMGGN